MNALQIVNELLSRFGKTEVSSFGATGTDSAIALRKVNLAINMIATHHPFTWLEKTTPGNITSVAGTSTYTLASDVGFILAAKHQYNGGGWIKTEDRKTLEMYRPDRSQSTDRSTPAFMTTLGRTLSGSSYLWNVELWPVPNTAFAGSLIYYYYTFIPTDLSATSDQPIVPDDFHWIILDMAESLYRTGPIRVGGDQGQIDLFQIANSRAQVGLSKLVSRDSAIGAQEMTWEVNTPEI